MSAWRRAIRSGSAAFVATRAGAALLRRRLPDLVVIFLWHGIVQLHDRGVSLFFDRDDLAAGRSSLCPPETFVRQLDFLQSRFQIVSLDDAIARLRHDRGFGHLAVITFDDGLRSVCEEAAPILIARGLPACLFINAALAGGDRLKATDIINYAVNRIGLTHVAELCARHGASGARPDTVRWRQRAIIGARTWPAVKDALLAAAGETEASLARRTAAYATWADLAALPRPPFSIGNHGAEHLHLPAVEPDRAASEIQEGAAAIRRHLGVDAMPYAYTFGDVDDVTPAALAVAGAEHGVALSAFGGFNLPGQPPGPLARAPVFSTPDPALLLEYAFPVKPLAHALVAGPPPRR